MLFDDDDDDDDNDDDLKIVRCLVRSDRVL